MDSVRQTGRTTQQMLKAPNGAYYIWCNSITTYPRSLALRLNRWDLRVLPLSVLDRMEFFCGLRNVSIVLDHATQLTAEQNENLEYILATRT